MATIPAVNGSGHDIAAISSLRQSAASACAAVTS